jgi:hypothetical protein
MEKEVQSMTPQSQDLSTERLEVVRHALASGLDGAHPGMPPSLEIVARKPHLPPAEPVCFLAQFNRSLPVPSLPGGPPPGPPQSSVDSVFLLRRGLNRVGFDTHHGDFERPLFRSTESSQWLVVVTDRHVVVTDDRSTNGSLVLPQGAPPIPDRDPRFEPGRSGFGQPAGGMLCLDGHRQAHELADGDVLISAYAAFVFGWIDPALQGAAP